MASVMKLTSSAAGKLIMRQGVLQALRGAASQVRLSLFFSFFSDVIDEIKAIVRNAY